MRRAGLVIAILAVLALNGCAKGGSASPQEAFESFKQAMKEKDFSLLWNMLSADSQRLMNEEAQQLSQAAAKAEGPAETALSEQARLIDMKPSELKTLNGEKLFVATLKIATATDEKGDWDKVSGMEVVKVDDSKKADNRVVITVKIEDRQQDLLFVKEGAEWKLDIGPDFQGVKKKLEAGN